MRPLDVAIFHDSQSRNAAPPQLSPLSRSGCWRTRLPSPSGTRNIMTAMPVVTPSRHGSPLRMPPCAPAAVSMMLLGPGVTAATTAKRRKATTCSVVVYCLQKSARSPEAFSEEVGGARGEPRPRAMHLEQTRTAGEGRERSCQGAVASWIASARPVSGVELFRAWFAGEAYRKHRHDTYAIGVTDSGVQVFDYRGGARTSTPGQVVVLYPDEMHDGRAGTDEGFGYRIVYVEPSCLVEAVRVLRGRPYPLPFVTEPVSTNRRLSHALEEAFRTPLESLGADSLIVDLAEGLIAGEWGDARPAVTRRVDVRAVDRARQFLDAERTRTVHSAELESITGLSRYDLARQFRIMLGTSPHRYLLMRRLDFTRERIHRGRPLAEVACDAGFADQAHFTRAFAAAFGLTPARYRALRKGQRSSAATSRSSAGRVDTRSGMRRAVP